MAPTTRRLVVAGGFGGAAWAAFGQATAMLGPDRLVLLGTRGGPLITGATPTPSANLIVFRGAPYVIDTGYGVTLKLLAAGASLATLRDIFITHHHSDHNLELGPLITNAWLAGLTTPLDVYAPKGLDALLTGWWDANRFDVETRIADEGRPDPRRLTRAHEFTEGLVMQSGEVRVTALRNRHPPVTESYALKFELGGKTVVFSGDTAYFPPLADFARGADILVHEALYGPGLDAMMARRPNAQRLKASILSHHTLAEDAGRIAAAAQVKTLVLNHFVPGDDPALTPQIWADAAAASFKGRIVVGRDLLSLSLA
ncbi:MAG TPA: MBL fold metallo-hydrolase [Phenylobacterium sp.]|nr:MBL fold metallo-hydrolase [Phenylobacterium sp.]